LNLDGLVFYQVVSYGFIDCWQSAGKAPPIKTCRFDTRIDYLYASTPFLQNFTVQSVIHVDDSASDHNLVLGTFGILKTD